MLKRKQTKESGSQASAPEKRFARGSPVEQLWEVKQGRTKGNKQKTEYRNREGTHERSGRRERGKPKKRKQKRSTEEATVRQKQEEGKRRNRKLSS